MHEAAAAAETVQNVEAAVEQAVLKAEAPIEHAVESIQNELPEVMPGAPQKVDPDEGYNFNGP